MTRVLLKGYKVKYQKNGLFQISDTFQENAHM